MKNRRTARGRAPGGGANPLLASLAHVDTLITSGQFTAAMAALTELNQQFRDNPDVLLRLLHVAIKTDDAPAVLVATVPLARLRPHDPDIALNLAMARLKTQHIALAQRAFAAFVTRWPDHQQAELARSQAQELSTYLVARWAEHGFDGVPDFDLMARNEEVQNLLTAGTWAQAVRLAEQSLSVRPDFVALRNNLSLAYQNLGQTDRAIAMAREVLARDPRNLHALGNLTRCLVLGGQRDEAAVIAERLKAIPTLTIDIAVKQLEGLSFFGDDAAILAIFDRAQKLKDRDADRKSSALLHHLAAVAALRQGKPQAAHRRWQKALELDPGLELASSNLADLAQPVDERNAPWPYSIEYWIQRAMVDELIHDVSKQRSPEALTRAGRRFLQRHPQIAAIIPSLLERGDRFGREFAVRLAGLAQTPELLAALAAFAQSQAGSTELRLQAAQLAQQGGAMANGTLRFWQGGAWHETMLFGIEIHGEPAPHKLPPLVFTLQREAVFAMHAGQASKAERLLLQALAEVPNDPSLLNNLGAVYAYLGRLEEAELIARRLVAEYPDYLFGLTNMVHYLLLEGKLAEAQALIDPLLRLKRIHVSEFTSLAAAQVSILLAEGKFDGATSWLELWQQADAEHPHLAYYWGKLREAQQSRRRRGYNERSS
jgi:tetratricopeptide (TPR) repeat protein